MCLITFSIDFCFGFFKPKLRGVETYRLLMGQLVKKRLRAVLPLDGSCYLIGLVDKREDGPAIFIDAFMCG